MAKQEECWPEDGSAGCWGEGAMETNSGTPGEPWVAGLCAGFCVSVRYEKVWNGTCCGEMKEGK